MPVEELWAEYNKQRAAELAAIKKQDEILAQIAAAKDKEWDMITVQKAAMKSGLSVPTIYRYLKAGRLTKVSHKGTRIYVSDAELQALDDK
ncbi:MAG: helix-turn-helix domain-containing protein [Treponema sp.]|nr:helix-turn-helix domain-containing protein [Treponema sp.]